MAFVLLLAQSASQSPGSKEVAGRPTQASTRPRATRLLHAGCESVGLYRSRRSMCATSDRAREQ